MINLYEGGDPKAGSTSDRSAEPQAQKGSQEKNGKHQLRRAREILCTRGKKCCP